MKSFDWLAGNCHVFASNCLTDFCIQLSDLYVVRVWQENVEISFQAVTVLTCNHEVL